MKKKFVKAILPVMCIACMSYPAYAAPDSNAETAVETVSTEKESTSQEDGFSVDSETGMTEQESTETEEATDAEDPSDADNTEPETERSKESAGTQATAETETEAETDMDMITQLDQYNGPDAEGYVTMTFSVAEDVTLPVELTMKNKGDLTTLTVSYQDQQIRIKPGAYTITKAIDGNGKKLDTGANLTIPEENGNVYLDFHKPKSSDNMFLRFINTNIIFVPLALIIYGCYLRIKKH